MRYLHPVAVHEKFVASGLYRFYEEGVELKRTESFQIHEHQDGSQLIRVDEDARFLDGKSILLEAFQAENGQIERFDIVYDNPKFENGIKSLRATYLVEGDMLQVGRSLNGGDREYSEIQLDENTVLDLPFCIFRGLTIKQMTACLDGAVSVFAPLFEQPKLFPGVIATGQSPAEFVAEETISLGQREISTKHYRYPDNSLSYWIEEHNTLVKRISNFQQREFVTHLTNYAYRR